MSGFIIGAAGVLCLSFLAAAVVTALEAWLDGRGR